jgi:AraC-like DNA-binding protein
MALLIDTRRVAACERAAFWSDATKDVYNPLRVHADRTDRFDARMWGESLASVGLFRITASAHTMSRTSADVDAGDPHSVYISLLLRGSLQGSQGGREFMLDPGDLTAHDSSHPESRWSSEAFDVLVVKVPKMLLGRHTTQIERLTAVRIPGGAGLPRLAGRFFVGTAAGLADGSISRDDTVLADLVTELVRRLYDAAEVPSIGRPRSRAETLSHAMAYIDAHLGDPDLDPEQIARACFISKRYLYGLFAAESRTVCDSIRTTRLERCRRDLLDPGLDNQSIAMIATRWGLPSAPHFSRLFRAVYGRSPSEMRRDRTPIAVR